jgi:endonuclease G
MKYCSSLLLLAVLMLACKPATAPSDNVQRDTLTASALATYGTASVKPTGLEIPKTLRGDEGQILRRTGYTASYNARNRIPNWVAWHLPANHVAGRYNRNNESFHEDTEVSNPRAYDSDYRGSGYDRGHMCPSGDNKWSREAQEQSFLFTNICPQRHNLNTGAWNDLELQCRAWAKRYGDLYIVCGPVLLDEPHRTIGRNRVVVPEAFFKVVLRKQNNYYKAIGFLYENRGASRDMSRYVRSVDEIEKLTGLDFFSELADNIESKIEQQAELRDWYPLREIK